VFDLLPSTLAERCRSDSCTKATVAVDDMHTLLHSITSMRTHLLALLFPTHTQVPNDGTTVSLGNDLMTRETAIPSCTEQEQVIESIFHTNELATRVQPIMYASRVSLDVSCVAPPRIETWNPFVYADVQMYPKVTLYTRMITGMAVRVQHVDFVSLTCVSTVFTFFAWISKWGTLVERNTLM